VQLYFKETLLRVCFFSHSNFGTRKGTRKLVAVGLKQRAEGTEPYYSLVFTSLIPWPAPCHFGRELRASCLQPSTTLPDKNATMS